MSTPPLDEITPYVPDTWGDGQGNPDAELRGARLQHIENGTGLADERARTALQRAKAALLRLNDVDVDLATRATLTALQSVISSVTAKYTKPSSGIPAADLASDIPTAAQVAAKYTKPGTGIPLADLATTVTTAWVTPTQVDTRIQAIVGAAPAALDTLVEIATQLTNDETAATALAGRVATVEQGVATNATAIAGKANAADVPSKAAVQSNTDAIAALPATYGQRLELARRRRQPLPLTLTGAMASPPTIAFAKTGTSTITTPKLVSFSANMSLFRFTGVGPGNQNGSGFYGNTVGQGTACWFEWTTDAATMDLRLLGLNTDFTLFCDGVRVEDTQRVTDTSGGAYLYTVTFASAAPRTFRLFGINMAFAGVYVPATASVWRPAEARRPFAWSLGDSYTFGSGTAQKPRAAIMNMAELLSLDLLPDGIGGTGWTSTGATDPVTRVQTKLAALTQVPDYVFLDLGFNDAGGNMTALSSAATATITAARTACPQAKLLAFSPATPLGDTANLAAVRSALASVYAAASIPMVDVTNWVNADNKSIYTGGDNTHPTQAGHDFLGIRRAQAVSPLLVA